MHLPVCLMNIYEQGSGDRKRKRPTGPWVLGLTVVQGREADIEQVVTLEPPNDIWVSVKETHWTI